MFKEYKNDVDRFYKQMIYKDGETELTIKWQKRFKKNEGKLFTFLDHEGCPWMQVLCQRKTGASREESGNRRRYDGGAEAGYELQIFWEVEENY
jgi:hypothetical protein